MFQRGLSGNSGLANPPYLKRQFLYCAPERGTTPQPPPARKGRLSPIKHMNFRISVCNTFWIIIVGRHEQQGFFPWRSLHRLIVIEYNRSDSPTYRVCILCIPSSTISPSFCSEADHWNSTTEIVHTNIPQLLIRPRNMSMSTPRRAWRSVNWRCLSQETPT